MEMETEVERILLSERTLVIKDYQINLSFGVDRTMKVLNQLNALYPIKRVEEIPNDTDALILKMFLAGNKKAQEQNEWRRITLNDSGLILPKFLIDLRNAFNNWNAHPDKNLSVYLIKGPDEFIVNDGAIEREVNLFAEKNRIYAIEPEQIKRYHRTKAVLDSTLAAIRDFKIDFNHPSSAHKVQTFVSPFLKFENFPINNYVLNNDYILTGKFE